jgi:hypothetical protein
MGNSKNIFERAKNIRLNGESWQNAIQRAKAQVNYEYQLTGGDKKTHKERNMIDSSVPYVYTKGPGPTRNKHYKGKEKPEPLQDYKKCLLNLSENSDRHGWCVDSESSTYSGNELGHPELCEVSRKRRTGNLTCRRKREKGSHTLIRPDIKPKRSKLQKHYSFNKKEREENKTVRPHSTELVSYSSDNKQMGGSDIPRKYPPKKKHPVNKQANPHSNIRPDGKRCLVSKFKKDKERFHCTSNKELGIEGTDKHCGWTRLRNSGRLECRRSKNDGDKLPTPPQLEPYLYKNKKGGYFDNSLSDTSATRTSDFTNISDTTSYTMSAGSDYSSVW